MKGFNSIRIRGHMRRRQCCKTIKKVALNRFVLKPFRLNSVFKSAQLQFAN